MQFWVDYGILSLGLSGQEILIHGKKVPSWLTSELVRWNNPFCQIIHRILFFRFPNSNISNTEYSCELVSEPMLVNYNFSF